MKRHIGTWGLAVALALTVLPEARAQASRAKVIRSIIGCTTGEEQDPAQVASWSTLVVEARASRADPPASVTNHPVRRGRRLGAYAWQDFLFDQVRVVWRDQDVPAPRGLVRVRVYRADTPAVRFTVSGEPTFAPGERYLLCLTERDAFAFAAGPPHWRVTAGTYGAFLLGTGGTAVRRKGVDKQPRMTLPALRAAVARGTHDESVARHRAWRAKEPRGISY